MIWTFIIFIVAVSVATIAFPLFWNKLQFYQLPENSTQDYSQADSWLSALSDLEDDHALGRISIPDYQQQKLLLQRSYLEWQVQSGKTGD